MASIHRQRKNPFNSSSLFRQLSLFPSFAMATEWEKNGAAADFFLKKKLLNLMRDGKIHKIFA